MTSSNFAGPKGLRRLLDAVMVIGGDLDLHATLRRIVEAATELADARFGALGVIDESGSSLAAFITVGLSDHEQRAIGGPPKGHGILGLLIADPRPLRVPDLHEHPDSFGFPPDHPPMTSFLGVPVMVRGRVFGNLYLTEKQSAEVFTDVDEELMVALATAAGVAIDNARLHERLRDITLVEDRERIAMDLHDSVIQQLFAVGLSLQGITRLVHDRAVAERIQGAVDTLDTTIKRIRSTIFALDAPTRASSGVRDRVLDLVAEMAVTLGSEPMVMFDGPLDSVVDPTVADDLLLVTREGLSNVARHAQATRIEITVRCEAGHVVLRIDDDGVGLAASAPPAADGGRGVPNLTTRAARMGGTFSLRERETGRGTTLEWRVPHRAV